MVRETAQKRDLSVKILSTKEEISEQRVVGEADEKEQPVDLNAGGHCPEFTPQARNLTTKYYF